MTKTTTQTECGAIRDRRKPCKTWGDQPKLYCDCGCMDPVDLHYDITDVRVSDRAERGYADYILTRNGVRVGSVNTQYNTIYLDGVEYLGVTETSPLYRLVSEARNHKTPTRVSIESVTLVSEIIDTTKQDQDDRNANHPGYCRKCHTYCYGDCEASNV